jgi:hypothetical protein
MSTLLSELDSAPAQGDGDFVQNILNEMNGGSGPTNPPVQPPPAVGGFNQGVINSPNPNTIAPRQMDTGPATAHMIGNSQPTPADFAQIMNTGGGPTAAPQGGDQWGSSYQPQQRAASPSAPKRSWFSCCELPVCPLYPLYGKIYGRTDYDWSSCKVSCSRRFFFSFTKSDCSLA